MTPERISELATQAEVESLCKAYPDQFQRFARLVRNEVLEEAALACESLDEASGPCSWHYEIATQDCANAIRSMK